MEVKIEVPAHSKIAVSIKASRKKVKLKYTGTLCILYIDGVEKCEHTEGYKQEISTESAVVEYGRFQPLMSESNMNVEPKPVDSKADPLGAAMADQGSAPRRFYVNRRQKNGFTGTAHLTGNPISWAPLCTHRAPWKIRLNVKNENLPMPHRARLK